MYGFPPGFIIELRDCWVWILILDSIWSLESNLKIFNFEFDCCNNLRAKNNSVKFVKTVIKSVLGYASLSLNPEFL